MRRDDKGNDIFRGVHYLNIRRVNNGFLLGSWNPTQPSPHEPEMKVFTDLSDLFLEIAAAFELGPIRINITPVKDEDKP
jgi:hypothetical protein